MTEEIVKIKLLDNYSFEKPAYHSDCAVGIDLRASIDVDALEIKPLERVLVPTGIAIELPVSSKDNFLYEAQVRPRSSLSLKKGLTLLNTPGTIDPDYRGEIKIILVNISNEIAIIEKGERIAQLIISRVVRPKILFVDELSKTERGEGGFGSTGRF